jgi:hypothetical protein
MHNYPLYGLGGKWSSITSYSPSYPTSNNTDYNLTSYYSYDSGISTTEECCEMAMQGHGTVFWRWTGSGGSCEVYSKVGGCAAVGKNGTEGGGHDAGGWGNATDGGGKVEVDVYYEPIPRESWWYSFTVGNGPCGRMKIQSLWE